MDWSRFVSAIRIVELTATSRRAAIQSLVHACRWDEEAITDDEVLAAIEGREVAASTLVASDFALPHAYVHWDGDLRVVLGRHQQGVDYGVPTGQNVQLIILLIIGRKFAQPHVDVLAELSELLKQAEFREQLIKATDIRTVLANKGDTPS